MKRYKIIHPANIGDWMEVHAVGKTVRVIPLREEGQGDVPAMDAADKDAGCVILEVDGE